MCHLGAVWRLSRVLSGFPEAPWHSRDGSQRAPKGGGDRPKKGPIYTTHQHNSITDVDKRGLLFDT